MGSRSPPGARKDPPAWFQVNPARLARGVLTTLFAGIAFLATGNPLYLWIMIAGEICLDLRDWQGGRFWLWGALTCYLALLLVAPWTDMGKFLQHLRHYNGL